MATDYAEIITKLEIARTATLDALATGGAGAVQEWEIRGRRCRYRDLPQQLREIERLIKYYEALQNGDGSKPARTRARLRYN